MYKYRLEFIVGETADPYVHNDDINVIARHLVAFAVCNDYVVQLEYVLAYACIQTWDIEEDGYVCSCSSVGELQQAFDEVVKNIVSSQH